MFGYWFIFHLRAVFGYRVTTLFLHLVVTYYVLFATEFKKCVCVFLNRAVGECRFRDIYATFYNFAVSIIDRFFFLQDESHSFRTNIHNIEVVNAVVEKKRGGILLGSHFGPMEVARLYAVKCGYSVSALIFSDISPRLRHFMQKIDSDIENSWIKVSSDSVDYILEVKNRIDDGGFVGVLGDRPWSSGRSAEMEFLGKRAVYPLGIYEIALTIGCPIIMTFVIKTGYKKYDIYFERLTDGERLPRKERPERVQQMLAAYVKRLEYYAKKAPTQWYNFFDYWKNDHV